MSSIFSHKHELQAILEHARKFDKEKGFEAQDSAYQNVHDYNTRRQIEKENNGNLKKDIKNLKIYYV